MRIRYRVAIAVALLVCISAGAWLVLRPPPEPSYDGKPLSYWLNEFPRTLETRFVSQAQFKEGNAAISNAMVHMGSNALPTLSRMLRARDSAFKIKVMELARRQRVVNFHFIPADQLNLNACNALSLMGDQAVFAVPLMAEVYAQDLIINSNHPPKPNPAAPTIARLMQYDPTALMLNQIAQFLGRLGSAASNAIPALTLGLSSTNASVQYDAKTALDHISTVPALIQGLQDPDQSRRRRALAGIQQHGGNAESALPTLLVLLQDPNVDIRKEALDAIKHVNYNSSPAIAIPALTKILGNPDMDQALEALLVLGKYGPVAKPAVPAIMELLYLWDIRYGGSDAYLSSEYLRALANIDPAAARAAGLE